MGKINKGSVREFIPKNSGMSLEDIASMINDYAEDYEIDFYIQPGELPFDIAQLFVDSEYSLHGDYEHQEDEVAAREELIEEFIKKLIKRKREVIWWEK